LLTDRCLKTTVPLTIAAVVVPCNFAPAGPDTIVTVTVALLGTTLPASSGIIAALLKEAIEKADRKKRKHAPAFLGYALFDQPSSRPPFRFSQVLPDCS
jgi:predicted outer membrane lipoprotein